MSESNPDATEAMPSDSLSSHSPVPAFPEKEAWRAVAAVSDCLEQTLGDQLHALFLYGGLAGGYYQPGHSHVNLLALVGDDFCSSRGEAGALHRLRRAFRPLWPAYGPLLRHAPCFFTRSDWARYRLLDPLLARRLDGEGQQVAGRGSWPAAEQPADRRPEVAALATTAASLSAALLPGLLEPEAAEQRLADLRRLTRHLRRRPVAETETAVSLFADLQMYLRQQLALVPDNFAWPDLPPGDAPPLLDQLRAIYERGETLLLLLPSLQQEDLEAIDWEGLAEALRGQYREVQLSTADQFRLSLQWGRPLDLTLRAYSHTWGQDPMAGLVADNERLLRQAAHLPAELLAVTLPHLYLSGVDVYKIIHDVQNRLLNIQLQHELLSRILKLAPAAPPDALPDRAASASQRIDGIVSHLNWWVNHYLD